MKVVFVEIDRCIACLNCMRVCTFRADQVHHCQTSNIFINVDMDRRRIFAGVCLQCEAALCMKICPTAAIRRDADTGALVVAQHLCIGCGMCVTVCPFGNMQLDAVRRVATKCDLCGGRPRCVQVCMARALHFGSLAEVAASRRGRGGPRLFVRALSLEEGERP